MAKKKKPDDDEDLPVEEEVVAEPDESAEVAAVEVDEAAVDEVEAEVEPASSLESMELEEDALAAPVGDDDVVATEAVGDADALPPDEKPRPAVHWANYVLIGLNVVAALAFAYFLVQDYARRQEYAYATLLTELAMIGLPNEDEEHGPTGDRATLPNARVTEEEIKRVVGSRVSGVNDPVLPVDEPIARRLVPGDLDMDLLKAHFGEHYVEGAGGPIRTIEDEVRRIDRELPGELRQAAEQSLAGAGKGGEPALRVKVEKLLLPLAQDAFQAEKLDQRIRAAQGKELQALYLEAAQRRMAYDFLLPLELYRPGDPRVAILEKFGDPEALPLDRVLKRVSDRVKSTIAPRFDPETQLGELYKGDDDASKRTTIEKRLTTALALLSLAHVKRPDGQLLYPKLLDRLPLVVGQYDFALAAGLLPGRVRVMNDRLTELLRESREGFEVSDGDAVRRAWGFPDRYQRDLQEIRFAQQDIKKGTARLQDLQKDKQRYEQLLAERHKQREDVVARIAKAREVTAKNNAELVQLQDQLFAYQRQLAQSDRQLQELSDKIRQGLGRKGGK